MVFPEQYERQSIAGPNLSQLRFSPSSLDQQLPVLAEGGGEATNLAEDGGLSFRIIADEGSAH